jgi:hypothetical protein
MKVIANEKNIKRYRTVGNYALIGSLVIIGIGFYFLMKTNSLSWGVITMSVSFILSQIGIYFGNRFGIKPPLYEQITQSLKGLENKFSLYHYSTIVPHLLVGPSGLWVIVPFTQRGNMVYEPGKNRWKQKKVSFFAKVFMQENLGRPDAEVSSYVKDIEKELGKVFKGQEVPPVKPVIIFTNPKSEVNAEGSPVPAMPIRKLKDFIRQQSKIACVSEAQLNQLRDVLPKPEED